MFLNSDTSTVVKAENELRLQSSEYTNTTTFLKNDLEEGGDIENVVKGNYTTRIVKETSTFAIESEGDIRTNAKGTRYERVEGNMFTQIDGKYRIQLMVERSKLLLVDNQMVNQRLNRPIQRMEIRLV